MDIYTAVKKERMALKNFLVLMGVISMILPLSVLLTNVVNFFYLSYLIFIEILIAMAVVIKLNSYKVFFKCHNNRLEFITGLSRKNRTLICDKVVLVHTNKSDYDLEIIIITTMRFKNKSLRCVDDKFLKKYPQTKKIYTNIVKLNPQSDYYFQIIRKGGLKKYLLLDCLYKNCVKAIYTDESIQNIKIARGQTIV